MNEELVEMLYADLVIYSPTPDDLMDLLDENDVECWFNSAGNVTVPWDGGVRRAVSLCVEGTVWVDTVSWDAYYRGWTATILSTGSECVIYVSFIIPSHPTDAEKQLLQPYTYIENGEEKIDLKNLISFALL